MTSSCTDIKIFVEKLSNCIYKLVSHENLQKEAKERSYDDIRTELLEARIKLEIETFLFELVKSRVCDPATLVVSLMYLVRVIPLKEVDLTNYEDVFAMCTVLSSKMWEEVFWQNRDYIKILDSHLDLDEFNALEKEILKELDWNLYISKQEYSTFVNTLFKESIVSNVLVKV